MYGDRTQSGRVDRGDCELRPFGDESAQNYIMLAKAMRSFLSVWHAYVEAPQGSLAEHLASHEMDQMMTALKGHPDTAMDMVEGFATIIEHMRRGNPYEQFAFINRATGPLAWGYWIMVACNVMIDCLTAIPCLMQ